MPPVTPPRAVLWDLDGTLIDSHEYHWFAWRDVMAAEGRPVEIQEFASAFGLRNDTILRGLLGADVALDRIQRIGDAKEVSYRRYVRERGLVFLPGARDWLARLRAAGWKQAIASSAPAENIQAAEDALGLTAWVDAIASADEVGKGKPDPAIFLRAAEKLGVPAPRCIVVEDAPSGLEGARRAGMKR